MSPVVPAPGGTGASDGSNVGTTEPLSWISATKEVRSTAKWVIVALAATATAVIGTTQLLARPTLSWSDGSDRRQLLAAWVLGSIAVGTIVWLILIVSEVLRPTRVTLRTLPAELVNEIDSNPRAYLPDQSNTFAEFRTKLVTRRQEYGGFQDELRKAKDELDSSPKNSHEAVDAQQKFDSLTKLVETARINDQRYTATARDLLELAGFMRVEQLSSGQRFLIGVLGVVAAATGIGFQLVLSEPAQQPAVKADSDSTSPGHVAYLVKPIPGTPGATLWAALALGSCEAGGGRVPVVVSSGKGSPESPWSVTTVAVNTACAVKTFPVESRVLTLDLPNPQEVSVTVTSTPASKQTVPTPSSSS